MSNAFRVVPAPLQASLRYVVRKASTPPGRRGVQRTSLMAVTWQSEMSNGLSLLGLAFNLFQLETTSQVRHTPLSRNLKITGNSIRHRRAWMVRVGLFFGTSRSGPPRFQLLVRVPCWAELSRSEAELSRAEVGGPLCIP